MDSLVDMHCHLDFSPHPERLAEELACSGSIALCNTVTPHGFERAHTLFRGHSGIAVALGLHPWWIADGRCGNADIAAFERIARSAVYVGEVGLDFSARCLASGSANMQDCSSGVVRGHGWDGNLEGAHVRAPGGNGKAVQVAAFERVVAACCASPTVRLVSLHAVHAESAVLDVLERYCNRQCVASLPVWVFHGFGGSQQELQRALDAGCFFSIGPRMMRTKRGRAAVRALPEDRIVLETDLPSQEGESVGVSVMQRALAETLEAIMNECGLRAFQRERLLSRMCERSLGLLGQMPLI